MYISSTRLKVPYSCGSNHHGYIQVTMLIQWDTNQYKKLISRWDSERELLLQHRKRTRKYKKKRKTVKQSL